MNRITRRNLLIKSSMSVGSLPLRALITGLPISFLSGVANHCLAAASDAKFLIMSHQQSSDPVNANVPGTYAQDPNNTNDPLNLIQHATSQDLGAAAARYETPIEFSLGSQNVKAAQPWSELDADLREQLGFWHHGTFTTAHPELPSVLAFNGAIKGPEGTGADQLDALIAQETAGQLNTLLSAPISIGGSRIRYDDRDLPVLKPLDIKNLFQSEITNIDQMVALRDRFIDQVYNEAKQSGSPAQKAFMDRYALSQQEASQMGDSLGELITDIDDNEQDSQVKMAVALIQLNLTPVVTVGLDFGGDNHPDITLNNEVTQTNAAIPTINLLWQRLKAAGIEERVVVSSLNVFGRTLLRNAGGGRDHNGNHHCMFVFGSTIKAGVIGGLEPTFNNQGEVKDFSAMPIHSVTGASTGDADIPHSESLVAMGKTLAKAVGVSDEQIEKRFDGGKVIAGALKNI